jgi:hypothetical protein
MKTADGKLVPETQDEARDMVRLLRQVANNKLDWCNKSKDKAIQENLTEAARDLLDQAKDLADKWKIEIP